MGKTTSKSSPTLFSQSKLLCFSLLYLSTSLFLALYTSLSKPKCLFRSSHLNQIQIETQKNLFSYPFSYGEHKYAVQTLRSTCSSPLFFSDYSTIVKKIDDLCKVSHTSYELRYIEGNASSFGGNFSSRERFSYFHRRNETSVAIPCGFFKNFPIGKSDRMSMENCRGVIVVSAIFNDHDKIRQPRNLGPKTLENVCFFMFVDDITLKALDRHKLLSLKDSGNYKIGVWKIVEVSSQDLYENPAMNGIIPKYLVHRLFPNAKFSIWIDAKLQLTVDPLLLVHSLLVLENADVAVSKHPFFVHTMEEAMATARWNKWWDIGGLRRQIETYCEFGLKPWTKKKLPYTTDVPDSALIFRKHDVESNLFSCLMFNELEGFNPRDQLAFAFVRDNMRPKLKVNMFEVEVFERIAMEYRHNLKKPESGSIGRGIRKMTQLASPNLIYFNSSCYKYLLEMWGETDISN